MTSKDLEIFGSAQQITVRARPYIHSPSHTYTHQLTYIPTLTLIYSYTHSLACHFLANSFLPHFFT